MGLFVCPDTITRGQREHVQFSVAEEGQSGAHVG